MTLGRFASEIGANGYGIPLRFGAEQGDDLQNDFIHVDQLPVRFALLRYGANAVDDVGGALCISNNCQSSLACLPEIGILSRKPSDTGAGAGAGGGDRLIHFVGQGSGQLSHGGHAAGVGEIRLRVPQRFRRQGVFCEVPADHEGRFDPLGVRPQRRITHGKESMAQRVVEPIFEPDIFSCEAAIQKWPKPVLEELDTHELGHVHPDHASGRHPPIPLMHGIDSFVPVIFSDDQYGVRRGFEDLAGEIFRLVVLDDLPFEVFIGSRELCGSLRDSSFKFIARRADAHHEQGKDEEHEDPQQTGFGGGLKEVSAEKGGQDTWREGRVRCRRTKR